MILYIPSSSADTCIGWTSILSVSLAPSRVTVCSTTTSPSTPVRSTVIVLVSSTSKGTSSPVSSIQTFHETSTLSSWSNLKRGLSP